MMQTLRIFAVIAALFAGLSLSLGLVVWRRALPGSVDARSAKPGVLLSLAIILGIAPSLLPAGRPIVRVAATTLSLALTAIALILFARARRGAG